MILTKYVFLQQCAKFSIYIINVHVNNSSIAFKTNKNKSHYMIGAAFSSFSHNILSLLCQFIILIIETIYF